MSTLARPDKWYLADGLGAIWAPPFPVWLREPGFWDRATFYQAAIEPLFSVALVDRNGKEIELRQVSRTWRPDRLTCRYKTETDVELTEVKEVLPPGRYRSMWSWRGAAEDLHLAAFTVRRSAEVKNLQRDSEEGPIRWQQCVDVPGGDPMLLNLTLSAFTDPHRSRCAATERCQGTAIQPNWSLTPFKEIWQPGQGLHPQDLNEGIDHHGLDFYGLSLPLVTDTADSAIGFELQIACVKPDTRTTDRQNDDHWHRHFDSYPRFTASDPFLERYYDYRIYGLHLCEMRGPVGNLHHATIAEGIDYFHVPITYSGQCHMLETRWSSDPDVSRGTLLNFIHHQKPNGSFHGRVYTAGLLNTDFYHANWGDATIAVDAIHPSNAYLKQSYDGLSRYHAWLCRERDVEQSGMISAFNHFETGQEYMSRYQIVNAQADQDGWNGTTRLKAIDATVYAYQLAKALRQIAARLGDAAGQATYAKHAQSHGSAILERMWSDRSELFSDVDPKNMQPTHVKAAVCFYPLLTDLLDDVHIDALLDRLTNESEFATPWPFPSSSVDDPEFDPAARWRGRRHACPWNGRVWPMINSHIIEGLVRQWRYRDITSSATTDAAKYRCGVLAGRHLMRFVRMMFHDGDLSRPNCFEHYNPYTGQACEYRGIDDYQHSCVVDLVVRAVMGVHINANSEQVASLIVDPVPMELEHARIRRLWIRGVELDIERRDHDVTVRLNGKVHQSTLGQPLRLTLSDVRVPAIRGDSSGAPIPVVGKPRRTPRPVPR
ncbi:MAG: hypothetical protein MI725_00245 [Pirellulales bacterium]|nr:hypothetical protein [Pirellulales bacterium]